MGLFNNYWLKKERKEIRDSNRETVTSYHRSANFSVLPLREFACFVCLIRVLCAVRVFAPCCLEYSRNSKVFFLLPFRRNHLDPARNCEKIRRNKTRHSLKTTIGYVLPWNQPNLLEYLPGISKVSFFFYFNCFSVKKKKKNKIEAGLFGFQQVVPIRTYFLYHNLKKKTIRKNLFSFAQVGMYNLLMGHFSRPKSPVKWNKICFSNSGWSPFWILG